jgi:hypothetical protein
LPAEVVAADAISLRPSFSELAALRGGECEWRRLPDFLGNQEWSALQTIGRFSTRSD